MYTLLVRGRVQFPLAGLGSSSQSMLGMKLACHLEPEVIGTFGQSGLT